MTTFLAVVLFQGQYNCRISMDPLYSIYVNSFLHPIEFALTGIASWFIVRPKQPIRTATDVPYELAVSKGWQGPVVKENTLRLKPTAREPIDYVITTSHNYGSRGLLI
jgi:hypothetical protein